MPSSSKSNKVSLAQPLLALEWSLPTLLVALLWCAHLTLNIVGLTALWSDTFLEIVTNDARVEQTLAPSLDENGRIELYKSTYKDNVKQFWDADAGAVAVILVFAGLVQPTVKCAVLGVVAFRPLSLETRERLLAMQEATSKLTTAPFYVEAILLLAFTYTYTVERLDLRAKIYMELYEGLLLFFAAQLVSFLLLNVLRVLQRRKAASLRLDSSPSHARAARSVSVAAVSEHGTRNDREAGSKDKASPTSGIGGSSNGGGDGGLLQTLTARRTSTSLSVGAGGGLSESLLVGRDDKGGSGGAALLSSPTSSSTESSSLGGQPAAVAAEAGEGEGAVFGRDSAGRQWRRDLGRASVVVPGSVSCCACFWFVWTRPFLRFTTTGLLVGLTDESVQELSFKGVADGVLQKSHPMPYALFFSFWFYMNLVVIPTAVPVLVALDALLALLPHFGPGHSRRRNRHQHWGEKGSMTSSSNDDKGDTRYQFDGLRGVNDNDDDSKAEAAGGGNSAGNRNGRRPKRVGGARGCLESTLLNRAWASECRRVLRDSVQLLAVWGTAEAALVAVFFVAPNIGNVAHWVFDDMDPCPSLEKATGGAEQCVEVSASILATGGVALVSWVALYLLLVRVLLGGKKSLSQLLVSPTPRQQQQQQQTRNYADDDSDDDNNKRCLSSTAGGSLVEAPAGLSGMERTGFGGRDEEGESSNGLLGDYEDDYDEEDDESDGEEEE